MYYLVVEGETGKYTRGNSAVICLKTTDLDAARKNARLVICGDKEQWSMYELDCVGSVYKKFGVGCLLPDLDEPVLSARIVRLCEDVDLDCIRQEIETFQERCFEAVTREADLQELKRLREKLGEQ